MTDLVCPNCGSDKRVLYNDLDRNSGFHTKKMKCNNKNNYMCMRCGAVYRQARDNDEAVLVRNTR